MDPRVDEPSAARVPELEVLVGVELERLKRVVGALDEIPSSSSENSPELV